MSSLSDDYFTKTASRTAPCPQGVNGLVFIPFLVKYTAMVVFDKKGKLGWREIQDSATLVSQALVTYHNNIFLQERLLMPIVVGERQIVFPDSQKNELNDIINCERRSAQVMRVVSVLVDMANEALSGGNDLVQLADVLKGAYTSSVFDSEKILKVFGECYFVRYFFQGWYFISCLSDTILLSIHNIADQLVSSMKKRNKHPPRYKLYWIVYYSVLRDFMSAIFKYSLFPEARSDSLSADELAGAIGNHVQKKSYLTNQRGGNNLGRKYSKLFSECDCELLPLVSVTYCLSMSKQIAKSEGSVYEMLSSQYVGGKNQQCDYIQVTDTEGECKQITDKSQLSLREEFEFGSFLSHYAKPKDGNIQCSAHPSTLIDITVAELGPQDNSEVASPTLTDQTTRKRKRKKNASHGE